MVTIDSGTVSSCSVSFLMRAAIADDCSSSQAKSKVSVFLRLIVGLLNGSKHPAWFVQVEGA